MSVEAWILAATAVLAVVAIGAAIIAVRTAQQLASHRANLQNAARSTSSEIAVTERSEVETVYVPEPLNDELAPRILDGRLIIPPTQKQVVETVLSRPGVRLSVIVHGVAHALRAESRDRIAALTRREFRRRRRERLQAGRRAVRSAQPTAPEDEWLSS